jgi:hypothetical protein
MVKVPQKETQEFMKIGDRIRVKESVIVYHHPENRSQPFDIKGLEGEIIAIIHEWQGRPVSANLPIQVKFDKKFKAHFRENEVELID